MILKGTTKVEVGQTWTNGKDQLTLSRIECVEGRRTVYYDDNGRNSLFGYLTEDGYPDCWSDCWQLMTTKLPQKEKEEKCKDELFAFFSRPQAGNCKCGMPKDQCEYHRDAKAPPGHVPAWINSSWP